MHPVGFEPTRIGDTVGLKSTSLDHSDKDARSINDQYWRIFINIMIVLKVFLKIPEATNYVNFKKLIKDQDTNVTLRAAIKTQR